mmetsp:Transcript_4272/g.14151  ORF Transcript_4272/g.14151 Transcript_4272/m.14151 type:complete len:168 (-) Transcript_4272:301-804(-)
MMRGNVQSPPSRLATVHVANLSPAIHTEMVRSIFAHFGQIVDIRLVASGAQGPYAFVDYSTEAAAEAAMSMSGQDFDGRRLRVERAKKSEYPPPPNVAPQKSKAEIYVGNMAFNTTLEMIKAYFEKFGPSLRVFPSLCKAKCPFDTIDRQAKSTTSRWCGIERRAST